MKHSDSMFENIEKNTNVKQEDIMKLVQSLQGADFQDEKTVRRVIRDVGALAGKPVSARKEDELTKAVMNRDIPLDLASLSKWFQSSR
ncbi:stage VI sporulation protein F [Salibacterium halotolerans]|uniref:Stage VI sporulation protein F n=1 Tax=Salibacterium halotolerans TaxID=1884432 RepID=A0A1I5Q5C9_9BACI|nr:stage VI sporulation protein F [Salibacterium halotolerans]SFP41200.1 Stage VI sporulation protein F [Salibacterium halotolerans]